MTFMLSRGVEDVVDSGTVNVEGGAATGCSMTSVGVAFAFLAVVVAVFLEDDTVVVLAGLAFFAVVTLLLFTVSSAFFEAAFLSVLLAAVWGVAFLEAVLELADLPLSSFTGVAALLFDGVAFAGAIFFVLEDFAKRSDAEVACEAMSPRRLPNHRNPVEDVAFFAMSICPLSWNIYSSNCQSYSCAHYSDGIHRQMPG